ncbi:MAG: Fe-S cluster assembly sulfur transfer protein SufU [Acidobacteriota bacterium]
MSELKDLYQEIILDHNKNPRNYGKMEDCTHKAEGFNPMCGDHYSIYLKVKDEIISEVSFEGAGCAISKSSASMMTANLKGKTIEDAKKMFSEFQNMMTSEKPCVEVPEEICTVEPLQGVREFPTRIKCATLIWHTMNNALNGKDKSSTE